MKQTYATAILLLFSATLFSQIVTIPDANFKSRIVSHNPVIDSNGDGEIQFSEAENFVGFLDVGNHTSDFANLIMDLTGIEAFINLTGFDAIEHSVNQNLDFSANPLLTELNLRGNEFSSILLSNNLNLARLDVGGNSSLTNLDVTANTKLEYLSIRHAGISTINLSNNTALVELEAFASDLASLDLVSNIELVRLSLGGTQITNIDLTSNTKLEHLEWQSDLYSAIDVSANVNLKHFAGYGSSFSNIDLSNNVNLDYLDLSNNPNLQGLDLSSNILLKNLLIADTNLSTLDLSTNTVLERLDIANAQFAELDLSNNAVLKSLNVKNNKFTDLDFSLINSLISVDVSNNEFLRSLNLKNGNTAAIFYFVATGSPVLESICVDDIAYAEQQFTNIDATTTFVDQCSPAEAVVYIPDANLKQALLDNVDINTNSDAEIQVAEAIAYTGNLNLFSKNISVATGLEAFVNITGLNLSTNNISILDVSTNIELTSLGVNRNNLSVLDVSNNTKLTALYVEENSLSNIDISKNVLLTSFFCKDNMLQSLDVSSNTLLQFLTVSNNEIAVLNVSTLLGLTNLVCTDNLLTSLDLSNNTNLTYLLCDQNQIASLDVSKNDKLETFACGYNDMTTLIMPLSSITLKTFACNNNLLESIDVSPFPNLEVLTCSSNPIPSLDLSGVLNLRAITCGNNDLLTALDLSNQTSLTNLSAGHSSNLSSVKVKNGNNVNMAQFYLINISATAKVCVDDIAYAEQQFTNIDATTTFIDQCDAVDGVVYIPDVNFKSRILNHNPVIDTNGDGEIQFSEAENFVGFLDVGNHTSDFANLIIDLTGIEAFINLTGFDAIEHSVDQNLDFSANPLLTELNLGGNEFSSILLTNNLDLVRLDVGGNPNLTNLDVTANTKLEYLSIRHAGISTINVSNNTALIELEAFASNLASLDLVSTIELVRLSLGRTQITNIDLTSNTKLEYLEWQSDLYDTIDVSANVNLEHFAGYGSNFSNIDLSNNVNLDYLDLSNNPNLQSLDLSSNILLKNLLIADTNLSTLDLSTNTVLERLDIANAQFSELDLSNNEVLKSLNVKNNKFTGLDLSCVDSLTSVDVSNNEFLRFVNLKNGNTATIFYFVATGSPVLESICVDNVDFATVNFDRIDANVTTFTENCGANRCDLNTIQGVVAYDDNNDNCVTGLACENITVTATSITSGEEFSAVTDESGNYEILVAEGTYTVAISSTLPDYLTLPADQTIEFMGSGNVSLVDHCVSPTLVSDIKVYLIPWWDARPGFLATYCLVIENDGDLVTSGSINLTFDNSKVSFDSAEIAPRGQTSNSLTWNYANLRPFQTGQIFIDFRVNVPPIVNGGDILTYTTSITPVAGDDYPEDNTHILEELVVNSFDPNDIKVMEGPEIFEEEKGNYLNYRIRFQNTGTASAINVVVENTLDEDLDWSTFEPTASSHDYKVEIANKSEVKFMFDNINLPDSTSNAVGSNGFITYKIKPKANAILGDEFDSKADIFFDYNLPIETNRVKTTIVAPPVTVEEDNDDGFIIKPYNIYPLPFSDKLIIEGWTNKNIKEFDFYSVTGKRFSIDQTTEGGKLILNTDQLPVGVYFVKLRLDNTIRLEKVIKQ